MTFAKLLFNFDISLADPSEDWWFKQKTFFLFEKQPLMVNMIPVST